MERVFILFWKVYKCSGMSICVTDDGFVELLVER